jgi:hypothetical protein
LYKHPSTYAVSSKDISVSSRKKGGGVRGGGERKNNILKAHINFPCGNERWWKITA